MVKRDRLLLLAGGEAAAIEPVISDDEVLHAIAGLRNADLAAGIGRVRTVGHGVLHEDSFGKERPAAIAGNGKDEDAYEAAKARRETFIGQSSGASELSGVVEIAANSAARQGRGAKR